TTREAIIRTLLSTMLVVAVVGDLACAAIWFAVGREWFFWVLGWTSGVFELLLAVWFLRLAMTRLRTAANALPTTAPASTAPITAAKKLAKRPLVGDAPMMWLEIHLRLRIWRPCEWIVPIILGLLMVFPSFLCYQGTIGPDELNIVIRFV